MSLLLKGVDMMKKLEKVLHTVNIVLLCMMAVHTAGTIVLGWLFEYIFFDTIYYVMLLCLTMGGERWAQTVNAAEKSERVMTLISALLLSAAGIHLLLVGILRPDPYHNIEELLCSGCMLEALEWYILPCLIWAIVRLVVLCLTAPKGRKLVPALDLAVFVVWLVYVLDRWALFAAEFGPGFYVGSGYYAGQIFIPVLMAVNVIAFLARNVRETLQLPKGGSV